MHQATLAAAARSHAGTLAGPTSAGSLGAPAVSPGTAAVVGAAVLTLGLIGGGAYLGTQLVAPKNKVAGGVVGGLAGLGAAVLI